MAQKTSPAYSSKYSKKTYTQHQHIALLCLKVREGKTYDEIVDMVKEMPRVHKVVELEKIPDPSTLCKAFDRLKSTIWRVMQLLTHDYFDLTKITGIDSSGMKRSHVSHHYTKRAKLHIKQLKTTLLVDTGKNVILDVHITTTRKHDSQIGPQIVERSANLINILLGDKGYDDQEDRKQYRKYGIRSLIKYREFTPLRKAWNANMNKELYAQRSQNESVNSSIKKKYGDYVRSRKWYKQFREVILKCLVYNIDRAIQLRKV